MSYSVVVKDFKLEDKNKNKDLWSEDKDKDKDLQIGPENPRGQGLSSRTVNKTGLRWKMAYLLYNK